MGRRESYHHGVFSWVELATSDVAGAREFYERLFGWEYDELPAGNSTYTMGKVGDAVTVGMTGLDPTHPPPRWTSYINVDDIDEVAGRVEELGGKVAMGPFDVMQAGRMAVLQDPTDAWVCLWQAGERAGADLVNAHGSFSWNDLATTDVAAASEFYAELLGWEIGEVPEAPDERRMIEVDGNQNGGMAKLPVEGIPPHWLVFFAVDDLDTAVTAVREGGGSVMAEPMEIPAGRMVVVTDPQGAAFGLFAGALDD